MAVSTTLVLDRKTLTNVDDPAGRWQHEAGTARRGTTVVANYATVRRVTTGGTDAQNTAMLTTTLFFIGKNPPENITLQGAHDFSSGNQIGSVSAASGAQSQFRTGSFAYTGATNTLKITSPQTQRVRRTTKNRSIDHNHLCAAEVEPDERIAEAIGVVEANRDPDGRWPLQNVHEGQAHFQIEDGEGKPSRWNTLRAMRVLDWFAHGG